jgi:CBS domain containing-hemolysin-like protein
MVKSEIGRLRPVLNRASRVNVTILGSGIPALLFLLIGSLSASVISAAEPVKNASSPIWLIVLVIAVLLTVNALYVAAEIALIAVRPTRLETLIADGDTSAKIILNILESRPLQDKYIATAQLGIAATSLGLGMYGEPQIAHHLEPLLAHLLQVDVNQTVVHTISYFLVLSVLTYLHVVLGEMVPKSLALTSADKVVLRLNWFMRFSQFILGFPVFVLNNIGNMLLRLLRVPPAHGEARLHSTEELELIVEESAQSGLINEDEEEMLLNIFDFSDRAVAQVMTARPKIQAIPHDAKLAYILELVTKSKHSRFPVYEGSLDKIIGVVHLKDLIRQQLQTTPRRGAFDIRLLLHPAAFVPENYPVHKLLAILKKQRRHLAVVLDEFGGTAGIVTLEDLVEEIVGEIQDEFDLEREPVLEISPGVLEVVGTFLVDDLKDYVYLGEDSDLPDVETTAGLIVTWLGRPPRLEDKVSTPMGNVYFTVLAVDGLAVARARVEYPMSVVPTKTAPSNIFEALRRPLPKPSPMPNAESKPSVSG